MPPSTSNPRFVPIQGRALHIGITFLGAFSYALMGVLLKRLLGEMDEGSTLFWRFLLSTLLVSPIVFVRPISIDWEKHWLYALRALLGFLMFLSYTYAVKRISVSNAMTLNFTYPLFVPLLLRLLFGESIRARTALGVAVGFGGIILLIHPSWERLGERAALVGLLSGLFSALANVTVRELRKTEDSRAITFAFLVGSCVFSIVAARGRISLPAPGQWGLLMGIALTTIITQQSASYVMRFVSINVVSSIFYSSVVFGMLLEWLIWGGTVSISGLVGSLLVFAAVSLTFDGRLPPDALGEPRR